MRRASSLGRSQGSAVPVRLSALGLNVESSADMGGQRHARSFIPKPSLKGRSSSAEREVKQAVNTLRRSHSNSDMQLIGLTTPATGQPSRNRSPFELGSQSRKAGHLGGGHHVKDPRPLGDKNYQNKEIEKVQMFLMQINADTMLATAVAKRSLTLKNFVDIAYMMLSHYFPKMQLNMTNFVDEIPVLAKKLHYPGNIMKSNLKTANSSHSWPVVLGFLSWLAEILQYSEPDYILDILFPNIEDLDDLITVSYRRKLVYYLRVFECWDNEKQEEESLEDDKISNEIFNAVGVSDEQIANAEYERNELLSILENEGHNQFINECKMSEEIFLNNQHKIKDFEEKIAQKISYKNKAPNELAQMQRTIELDKLFNSKCKTNIETLSKILVEAKNDNRVELLQESEQAISQYTTEQETYLQMVYEKEMKLARLNTKAQKLQTDGNKLALAHSGNLPMLHDIIQPGNFLLMDDDLKDMEGKLEELHSELKSEMSQLENILDEKQESMQAIEYKRRESEEMKALLAEIEENEAEDLQMKHIQEKEEAKLKLELRDIMQSNKVLIKDSSVTEKVKATLHQKEEEVKQAKLHNEQVVHECQDIIDKRLKLFNDFMDKVAIRYNAIMPDD